MGHIIYYLIIKIFRSLIHDISDQYKPIIEFLNSYDFEIKFEKTYDEGYQRQNMRGAKNVLLRKSV